MTTKKVAATQNAKTGSYTVRVPKSATTGKFVSNGNQPGQIKLVRRKAS